MTRKVRIRWTELSYSGDLLKRDRQAAVKAAEESIVLLKNNGALPFKTAPRHIAVIGPTADLLPSILGNYVGTPIDPVTPLDGMLKQFPSSPILYAQGSTLADGAGVPVPRTAFGLGQGLKTEFFATPDWTGRPVATLTAARGSGPTGRTPCRCRNWQRTTTPYAGAARSRFRLPVTMSSLSNRATAFLTLRLKVTALSSTARCSLKAVCAKEPTFLQWETSRPRPAPHPPLRLWNVFPRRHPFRSTLPIPNPHDFRLEYSHAGDMAGGGLTLKWEAPTQAQLDEAVARAKEADVVVAFVGLSPQLEGEEMKIKIDGFEGGDRTSLDLPAAATKTS